MLSLVSRATFGNGIRPAVFAFDNNFHVFCTCIGEWCVILSAFDEVMCLVFFFIYGKGGGGGLLNATSVAKWRQAAARRRANLVGEGRSNFPTTTTRMLFGQSITRRSARVLNCACAGVTTVAPVRGNPSSGVGTIPESRRLIKDPGLESK